MADSETLYLVDGSSYLYRAFHALPPLTNSAGEPTGALLGVANMLRRLVNTYQPGHVAVVFDARGKTFRHQIYPEYKANRPSMPDELAAQVEPLHELVRAMGLPLLQVPEVEADDVIGTLARQARAAGMRCLISTGDKDLAQLVDGGVMLEDTMKDQRLDRAGVEDKFGVPPERFADYLALVGDTSDNIPGVRGVGPKTAAKWLQQYGDLDNLIEHAGEVKGKAGENLRAGLEQLRLSRELVAIRTDVDTGADATDLQPGAADERRLRELLQHYEFNSWLRELDAPAGEEPAAGDDPRGDYATVLDQDTLQEWLEAAQAAGRFAFDTETTSQHPMHAELVGISLATAGNTAAYIPIGHDYPGAPDQLDRQTVLDALGPILADPAIGKIGQNLKYDVNVLRHCGVEVRGITDDSMLESYAVNSTATRHNLDALARHYLDREAIPYSAVAGSGRNRIPFNQVAIEEATPYAAEDAALALALHETLRKRLDELPGPRRVYRELEMPLLPVLAAMEYTGVLVDAELLAAQSRELADKLGEIEARVHEIAGHAFNLGSPKQLQQVLFEELELPVVARTGTGQPSTNEEVLEELTRHHELPQLILDYRGLSKLRSTYTDRLPEQIHPETGRIHTSYHQAVTATGRLSSSDPNLQNIPVRTPEGRRIRKAFVAPPGRRLLAADYSQVELRIMAHLSGDQRLLEAFGADRDIHQATAAEVFAVAPGEVSGEQRRAAKAINFGLMYGMSAWGLARQLGVERDEAQRYIDTYFERYPGVHEYMERTRKQAAEQGYVETLFGRRLWLPEIRSRNYSARSGAERAAINAPMQGSAADIIKRAMIDVAAWLAADGVPAAMVMQVHDELVFEVDCEAIDTVTEGVEARMSAAAELAVPLLVDIGVADNWDEAH